MAFQEYEGTVRVPENNERPACDGLHGGKAVDNKKKVEKASSSNPYYLRKGLYE